MTSFAVLAFSFSIFSFLFSIVFYFLVLVFIIFFVLVLVFVNENHTADAVEGQKTFRLSSGRQESKQRTVFNRVLLLRLFFAVCLLIQPLAGIYQ